jgi:hypothetical protein
VTAPIIQIFSLLFAITHLALELLPYARQFAVYRSFVLRIVTYTMQTFVTVLYYQVSWQASVPPFTYTPPFHMYAHPHPAPPFIHIKY